MIGEIIYIGRRQFGRIVSENIATSTTDDGKEFQFTVVRVEPTKDRK